MTSAKWRPFCLGFDVSMPYVIVTAVRRNKSYFTSQSIVRSTGDLGMKYGISIKASHTDHLHCKAALSHERPVVAFY